MPGPAIRVDGLSKRYRIGAATDSPDTLVGTLLSAVRRPLGNLRRLRSLSHFGSTDSDDVIWALRDVSFEVAEGEVLGIIGANGAGKSTLLKILARITSPTSGRVELEGRVASLLEVGTGFHPELTGRENIYLNGSILGMRKAEIDAKLEEVIDFSGIRKFVDTPLKRFSSGMAVRLAFSVAAHLEPEILLIDEVLAVGDVEFRRKSLGKMREVATAGRTVLFVSHNLAAVSTLCDRVLVVEEGRIKAEASAEDGVETYLLGARQEWSGASDPGVLYSCGDESVDGWAITRIEILDAENRPKENVFTYDEFVIRLHVNAPSTLRNGSVVVELATTDGRRLIMLSTFPDSNLELPLEKGVSTVDCVINRLPLAAGDYVLGAGLAVPNVEWLCRDEHLAVLRVLPRDVRGSGLAPESSRALLVVDHEWRLPRPGSRRARGQGSGGHLR